MLDQPDVLRSHRDRATIGVGPALGTWAIAWTIGGLVVTPLLILAAGAAVGDDLTIPQLSLATAGAWVVFLVAVAFASRRFGTGDVGADLGLGFRPIDLLGIPVGVATQLLAIPALYWPLRDLWPDTFSTARLEERAQELADKAGGWTTVLLAIVVVVGAPVVEEVVYRGLVQRSLTSAGGIAAGIGATSLLFAAIHLSPIEIPGLFLAGVVFGVGVAITGRIGPAVLTHAGFNAAGLVLVLRS